MSRQLFGTREYRSRSAVSKLVFQQWNTFSNNKALKHILAENIHRTSHNTNAPNYLPFRESPIYESLTRWSTSLLTCITPCRVIFRAFQLPEKGRKNWIFNWVSKLNLGHQIFLLFLLNTTKIPATIIL